MDIFLSASIPDPGRDPVYADTMDLVAIRDAIRALATVVLPHSTLHFGGHPAITPLIRVVAQSMKLTDSAHVRLYQSAWFADQLPPDNAAFESVHLAPKGETAAMSLRILRLHMIRAAPYFAAIFIGGMDGVEDEFALFRHMHRSARLLPIASTGAAARVLFDREHGRLHLSEDLLSDYAYPSLFRRLLDIPPTSR